MRFQFEHLHKDFNFEFMKGGGAMPPQESEQSKAQARQWEADQAAKREDAKAKREKTAADAKYKQDVNASQGRVGSAYNSMLSDGTMRLAGAGLDPSSGYGADINNLFRSALNRARSSAPEIVTDASSLFGENLYDDAYNTVRTTARGKLSKSADEFMGDGFESTLFADTADDDILRSILGEQKKDLMGKIESAKARGQINDVGYQRAIRDLGNQESAGFSKANTLGQGVLSNYRKGLSDYAGSQRKRIDAYDFADNINLDSVRNTLTGKADTYKNSMRGDILAAIGGTNFFDEDLLLGTATGASGVQNNGGGMPTTPITTPLTSAYTNTNKNTLDDDKTNTGF